MQPQSPRPTLPPPCDPEIFQKGQPLLAADTSRCGAAGFEPWVRELAARSGQRVDWHYSGGFAQVLVLGQRARVLAVLEDHPCPGRIMRVFEPEQPGLYRKDVTTAPPGARAAAYEGGDSSVFM